MPPTIHERSVEIGGRVLTFETGRVAQLAGGAVTVRYGDTMVLSAATGEKSAREGLDFFPLTVEFEEKMYAAGKIPGGFIKREGRPTETAILSARLTDRPVRPLFPKGYKNEVQLVNTVISADQENLPDVLGINGSSAALMLSDIPWNGPVGAVRIGDINGELVVNPTAQQLLESKLDMVVAGTADAVMMVEGEASEISEERMLSAVQLAHDQIRLIINVQNELRELAGKQKREFIPPAENTDLKTQISDFVGDRLQAAVFHADKEQRLSETAALKAEVVKTLTEATASQATEGVAVAPSAKEVSGVFDSMVKSMVRNSILDRGERPDGRKTDEIRELWMQVGYLPRAHGSAIFTRGQTQVMSVATMGSTSEDQRLDGIGIEESKRYIHHYNFPPYSVGEVRFMRGPSRRDIGHGHLAERALKAVLPAQEEFPYVIRVVSEVVSSNGSTSMASVCGSTLSLMDAGVPIKRPVAGIAMGLVTDAGSSRYSVLTDIQGMEDALGDMDFKVAGTRDGVTAIQMDIKVQGITSEIMAQALQQARTARLFILDQMNNCLASPRGEMSAYAPRIYRIQIQPKQIGEVIGPGGKTIRGIQDATGAKLDIEDDGSVYISAVNEESARKAVDLVERMTRVPEVGDIFFGRVKTIIQSGCFVEILPGKDGFVHISELEPHRVNSVEDVVQVGQEVNVVVTGIRPDGKINLSRKALLTGEMPEPGSNSGSGPSGGGGRGRDDRRGAPDRRDRGPRPPRDHAPREHHDEEPAAERPVRAEAPSEAQPARPAADEPDNGAGGPLRRRPSDSRTLPGSNDENE